MLLQGQGRSAFFTSQRTGRRSSPLKVGDAVARARWSFQSTTGGLAVAAALIALLARSCGAVSARRVASAPTPSPALTTDATGLRRGSAERRRTVSLGLHSAASDACGATASAPRVGVAAGGCSATAGMVDADPLLQRYLAEAAAREEPACERVCRDNFGANLGGLPGPSLSGSWLVLARSRGVVWRCQLHTPVKLPHCELSSSFPQLVGGFNAFWDEHNLSLQL